MIRNTASQKVQVFAYDYSTGSPKTGDGPQLVVYLKIDSGANTALTDTSATEISSTNSPGWYEFDVSQAETNGNDLLFTGKSSTSNVVVVGCRVTTVPANFGLSAIDGSGRVDIGKLLGTAWLTPGTAGTPDVNVKLAGGTAWNSGAIQSLTLATDSITSTALKTNAIDKISAGVWQNTTAGNFTTANSVGLSLMNGVALGTGLTVARCTLADTLTTYTGNTVQTGDAFARIGTNGAGLSNITLPSGGLANVTAWSVAITGNVTGNLSGSVGSVATGGITAASIADGAIDRATFASDTGLQTIRSNTAQAGGGTTITLDASASATTDFYKNALVFLSGGTGVGQARFVTAYNGSTKVATVNSAWATNPDNTSTFALLPFDSIPGATAPTAAQVATAVFTDLTAGSDFSTVGSFGKLVKDNLDTTVSSRMATYTQPTGFLASTFPATVASPTNITAATGVVLSGVTHTGAVIPTVTSVTNNVNAVLADAAHGGSSASLTFSSMVGVSGTKNNAAITLVGNGTAPGIRVTGGTTGNGVEFTAGATGAYGALATGGTDGLKGVGLVGNGSTFSGNVYGMQLVGVTSGLDPTTVTQVQNGLAPATATTAIKAKTDLIPAAPAAVSDIPSAATIATAWGARVIGNGRTADMFLQGLTNRIAFAVDGLSFTLYSTDDSTPIATGTATRMTTDVGGLRSVDPA